MIAVLAAVVAVLGCAVLAMWLHAWRPDTRGSRVRQRAVVQTVGGGSWAGVVWEHDRSGLVLRNAEALDVGDGGEPLPVDGEVFVPAGRIDWIQLPG